MINGPMVKFSAAGAEPQSLHALLLASHSKALESLVCGQMKESMEKLVKWEDVDEATFGRFVEYVYTRDYSSANPVLAPEKRSPPGSVEEARSRGATKRLRSQSNLNNMMIRMYSRDAIQYDPMKHNVAYGLSEHTTASGHARTPGSYGYLGLRDHYDEVLHSRQQRQADIVIGSDGELEDLLFCHARLYVLADKWDIDNLKILALSKLCPVLQRHYSPKEHATAFIRLLRFVFENTPCKAKMDELRELVLTFLVTEAPVTLNCEAGFQLLEEGGPVARDITLVALRKGNPAIVAWNNYAASGR